MREGAEYMPRTPRASSPAPNLESWARLWGKKGTRGQAYRVIISGYIAERTSDVQRGRDTLRHCKNCGMEYDPASERKHISSGCIVGEAEGLYNHLSVRKGAEIEARSNSD
jgi:hypothetical protein